MADSGAVIDLLANPTEEEAAETRRALDALRAAVPLMPVLVDWGIGFGRGRGNHRIGKLLKEPGTSATGSITKVERQRRKKLRKAAERSRKRNR